MGVSVSQADTIQSIGTTDLIIDGVIGYSLTGAPHGTAAKIINWANAQASPILSLDVPSGLDTTTGIIFDPTIKATATMTLALPKEGLRADMAKPFVGELFLSNISVPVELYAKPSLELAVGHIFQSHHIVQLW